MRDVLSNSGGGWKKDCSIFKSVLGPPIYGSDICNTQPRNNPVESSLVYPEGVNSPDWALLIGLQAKLGTTCRHGGVTLGTWSWGVTCI